MIKELFFTEEGIVEKQNAELVLIEGERDPLNPIIEVGEYGSVDANRVQFAQFIHDKDGSLFGVSGRLHMIYLALNRGGITDWTKATYRTCYAYSDNPTGEKGSWIKPRIGRFLYNGNYDNNIIWETIATITHVPDAPYKLIGFHANGNRERIFGNSFDSLQTDGVSMMSMTHDTEQLFYSNGKVRFVYHNHLTIPFDTGGYDYIGRVLGVNEATNLFPTINDWTLDFGGGGSDDLEGTNTQDHLHYKVRIPDLRGNYEDEKYGTLPQDGVHNGSHLMSGEDIHGEYVLLAPDFQTNETHTAHGRRRAHNEAGLGLLRDFVNDPLITRIRGNEKDLIIPRSEIGWDRGWTSASENAVIETEREMFVFYEGWQPRETFIDDVELDIRQIGRAKWRKDGFTKISIQPNGYIKTNSLNISGELKVNHIGEIQVKRIRNNEEITKEITGDNINADVFLVEKGDTLEFSNLTDSVVELYSYGVEKEQRFSKRHKAQLVINVGSKLKEIIPLAKSDNGIVSKREIVVKKYY